MDLVTDVSFWKERTLLLLLEIDLTLEFVDLILLLMDFFYTGDDCGLSDKLKFCMLDSVLSELFSSISFTSGSRAPEFFLFLTKLSKSCTKFFFFFAISNILGICL